MHSRKPGNNRIARVLEKRRVKMERIYKRSQCKGCKGEGDSPMEMDWAHIQ